MSLRPDGRYRCDRDGTELENGGVHECVPASDIRTAEDGSTAIITLHFCRENGCAGKVLSARNLANYKETMEP